MIHHAQHFHLSELDRRLANLIKLGTIQEIDHKKARVRIQMGKICTDWLPWVTSRAGNLRSWSPPNIGEQVVVMSPSGDLGQGVVLPSLYQSKHPAPSHKDTVTSLTFPDGTHLTYDHEQHQLNCTIGESTITVNQNSVSMNASTIS